jgi:hypothetical protein
MAEQQPDEHKAVFQPLVGAHQAQQLEHTFTLRFWN